MWDSRLSWAGELPATGAVVHQRFDAGVYGSGSDRTLPAAAGPDWQAINWAGTAALLPGRWGQNFRANTSNPSVERIGLQVPHFPGLWPSTGKVLIYAWAALTYGMTFSPIITTRATPSVAPLLHLATQNDGRPRHQVFATDGTRILDQIETLPWSPTVGQWHAYLMCLDLDASTSQIAVINRDTGQQFISPARSFPGQANQSCTADMSVMSLHPGDAYWASGWVDEIGVHHVHSSFDLEDFTTQLRNSTWARGTDQTDGENLTITDTGATATGNAVLHTGAQQTSWNLPVAVQLSTPIQGTPLALLSTDNGTTWSLPLFPDDLPTTFTGLARWQIPLAEGEQFTGLELTEAAPIPTLDPITPITLTQRSQVVVDLTGQWLGDPVFAAQTNGQVEASFAGAELTLTAGMNIGDFHIGITVSDNTGQVSEPLMIMVSVVADPWEPADVPVFAAAPLIILDEDGNAQELIHDALGARILREVNGEQTLTFSIPVAHAKAHSIVSERGVQAVGENYRVRRIETRRDGGIPVLEIYCEASFYDLGVAGQVAETEFSGTQAGFELEHILAGTTWSVGAVNVDTSRSWVMERASVLACLRAVAQVHGGDLVFDNSAKTVSLLKFSGRDQGVGFYPGHGLTDARRVIDTTTLLTRIIPRNADGIGIEAVNDGLPYLEDFTYSNEIRTGEYQYASGTSPLTMLAMTRANIANRSRPKISYEATITDLSAWTGQKIDRFDAGDRVMIIDPELGISTTQRIVAMEYDLLRPWASSITLSEKLRELGSSDTAADAGVLTTGTDIDTRDLVPFNLLLNGRFDNGLAHWAASGVSVVDAGATGTRSAVFTGAGSRWIEQTVATDTRDAYTLSVQVEATGGPSGWVPDLVAEVHIVYDDDSTETARLNLM